MLLKFKHLALLLVTCMMIFLLANCRAIIRFFKEKERAYDMGLQHYSFDPSTILSALSQGHVDVFVPIENPGPAGTPILDKPIRWTQANYLQVADVLLHLASNETMNDMNLGTMDFYDADCSDIEAGFQNAYIMFYKYVGEGEQRTRVEYTIVIRPLEKSAFWGRIDYRPTLSQIVPIDWARLKLDINDALRIADDNGGAVARGSVKNECGVSASIRGALNWQIGYTKSREYLDFFQIEVDPLTGKYQTISP